MQERFKFPSSPFLNPSFRFFFSAKQLPSTKSPLLILYLSSNHSNYISPLFFYMISKKTTKKSHKSSPSLIASSYQPKEQRMGIYIVSSFKFAH
jgi:hypothetical protein